MNIEIVGYVDGGCLFGRVGRRAYDVVECRLKIVP